MFEVTDEPRRRAMLTQMRGHFSEREKPARIARQASEGDDVTIVCVPGEATERVLREERFERMAGAAE
jgi:prephenate dehydrogenase